MNDRNQAQKRYVRIRPVGVYATPEAAEKASSEDVWTDGELLLEVDECDVKASKLSAAIELNRIARDWPDWTLKLLRIVRLSDECSSFADACRMAGFPNSASVYRYLRRPHNAAYAEILDSARRQRGWIRRDKRKGKGGK